MNFPAPGPTGQRILLWIGVVLITIYGAAGLFLLELWPSPGPLLSDEELLEHFGHANTKFLFGVVLMLLSAGFFVSMGLTISIQIARLEKGFPYLAIIAYISAVTGSWVFQGAPVFFGAAAFRVDRSPELVRLLHDLSWLWYFTPGAFFMFQAFCITLIAFIGKQDDPTTAFPRWFGWFSLIVAIEAVFPPAFIPMFKTGPIAWDGFVAYYLALVSFGIWCAVMIYLCFRAIRLQEQAAAQAASV
ncbi:MAG: hypothetical protein OXC05_04355 [Halieaceae bacterium]|nr:hypothetical protein [Halieaceae bacterium]